MIRAFVIAAKVSILTVGMSALSGCASTDDRTATGPVAAAPSLVASVRAHDHVPRASIPTMAGAVLDVGDDRGHDDIRQDIVLAGGEPDHPNTIVLLARADGHQPFDGTLAVRPSEGSIKSELAARFPGIAMRVENEPSANAYGPYGLALGSNNVGDRCAYAWEWIEDQATLDRIRLPGPVAVRIALCRGDRSFAALKSEADHLLLGRDVIGRHGERVRTNRPVHAPVASSSGHEKTTATADRAALISEAQSQRYMAPPPDTFVDQVKDSVDDGVLSRDLPTQAFLGPRSQRDAALSSPGARP